MSTVATPSPSPLNPDDIDQLRTEIRNQPPDIWTAAACGLVGTENAHSQLTALRIGPAGTPELPGPCAATAYITDATRYLPYVSPRVPLRPEGESIGRSVLKTAFSPDVVDGTGTGFVASALLAAQATLDAGFTDDTTGEKLTALAAAAPKKGGEINRLLPEYLRRHAESIEHAGPMAMRDFWSSWYVWIFPRLTDGRIPDLLGSVGCLTTAIDYVGAADDAGGGGRDAYLAAAGEGLACLSGPGATQILRDITLVGALMTAKDAMAARHEHRSPAGRAAHLEALGGPVTPQEILLGRWWDGGLAFAIRFALCTADYRHLSDEFGAFRAADRCGRIRRALNTGIWHNEITDLMADHRNGDFLNGARQALAARGGPALLGYADACARVTDDALTCDCGADGHEEAAEFAMGCYLWFALAARYMVRRQVAHFCASGSPVQQDFAWLPPRTRLTAVALTTLPPGSTLHSPDWRPLWTHTSPSDSGPDSSWAGLLARRTITRCLPRTSALGMSPAVTHHCEESARTVLELCDQYTRPADLRTLADAWCALFDTLVATTVTDSGARLKAAQELRPLVHRIWRQSVVGYRDAPHLQPDDADETLYLDIDHALRRTYSLPPTDGYIIRRVFLGITTSAAELSGLNPYALLSDGTARHLAAR
ncbi:hypothetical protein AB0D49_25475 [Streptomyces sp. NPDC048290]|uniref:hypothetical protein n=1 Tax=Streptomyces sp. NPDC048290 TaxID=3155811 RepID=UPI003419D6B0